MRVADGLQDASTHPFPPRALGLLLPQEPGSSAPALESRLASGTGLRNTARGRFWDLGDYGHEKSCSFRVDLLQCWLSGGFSSDPAALLPEAQAAWRGHAWALRSAAPPAGCVTAPPRMFIPAEPSDDHAPSGPSLPLYARHNVRTAWRSPSLSQGSRRSNDELRL